ncbi:tRNA-specific adenosine deaminase [Carpediemonas membranifera]|uniref:Cytosine deaminase n=1 Tax=Carpediemonas membranifera TaxID=201153 RepID=A0A8J6BBP6_9EUKA|nr:Cytidine and deoxycytidylate deaminase zinc-binding region [Carpediemonas membranifera]KAG9394042.1 tRNA-specific adenosine deaminase [Carpediemonas membranifera]|eukprot:KAG9394032.1 Cytidine and deoxycytidylate deaminase zinc-binding region [Carpediemonas membranifera]
MSEQDLKFMQIALDEAKAGMAEGGIPIGACLVIDGEVRGRGHNMRVQKNSPTLHGEMSAMEDAGRLKASEYARATMYTTLSPCVMCTGTMLLYGIPRVVLAENENFMGAEELMKTFPEKPVEVVNLDLPEAKKMMADWIAANPKIWNEDIGVEN